jgi:hypothetical protein
MRVGEIPVGVDPEEIYRPGEDLDEIDEELEAELERERLAYERRK